jgi:hypothetical protein
MGYGHELYLCSTALLKGILGVTTPLTIQVARCSFNLTETQEVSLAGASKIGGLNFNFRMDVSKIRRIAQIALLCFLIILLVMTQIGLSALQANVTINMTGTIGTSTNANMIFSSGFEDSRDRGTSGNGDYNLVIYNQVTGAATHTYTYDGGSSVDHWWINGKESAPSGSPTVTSHSGSYCLGINRGGNNRAELQFRDWSWNSYNKWYFSMWLYFPSNWDTTPATSSGEEVMFAFGDSIYHQTGSTIDGGFPYLDIDIWRFSTPTYTLALCGRGFSDEAHTYDTSSPFDLAGLCKGKWSHWEIYFDRGDVDAHNGIAWVKVNGVEYLSASGIYAKWSGGYQPPGGKTLEIYPQDLYSGGYGTEFRYLDDLQIWNGVPP